MSWSSCMLQSVLNHASWLQLWSCQNEIMFSLYRSSRWLLLVFIVTCSTTLLCTESYCKSMSSSADRESLQREQQFQIRHLFQPKPSSSSSRVRQACIYCAGFSLECGFFCVDGKLLIACGSWTCCHAVVEVNQVVCYGYFSNCLVTFGTTHFHPRDHARRFRGFSSVR